MLEPDAGAGVIARNVRELLADRACAEAAERIAGRRAAAERADEAVRRLEAIVR